MIRCVARSKYATRWFCDRPLKLSTDLTKFLDTILLQSCRCIVMDHKHLMTYSCATRATIGGGSFTAITSIVVNGVQTIRGLLFNQVVISLSLFSSLPRYRYSASCDIIKRTWTTPQRERARGGETRCPSPVVRLRSRWRTRTTRCTVQQFRNRAGFNF